MPRFHHVNIGIPEAGLADETAFLVEVVGLRQLPDAPAAANWFEAADGVQLHVSLDPNHQAPARAHVALETEVTVSTLIQVLNERGIEYQRIEDEVSGPRLFCTDPAGNLWELRTGP